MLFCIGVVIGTLTCEDGRPVDHWGFPITHNALVSFIATWAKLALLLSVKEATSRLECLHYHDESHRLSDLKTFDKAIEGPLGFLSLMILQNKMAVLNSCAAALMIAILLIDPFVQIIFDFHHEITNEESIIHGHTALRPQ